MIGNNRSGIYRIIGPSGTSYIGSAVNLRKRWREHRACLLRNRHQNSRMQRIWNKYGAGIFTFTAILYCAPKDLLFYEQRCLDYFGKDGGLLNICPKAGSALGFKWSEEARRRMSEKCKQMDMRRGSRIGWHHSEATRAKLRGRKLSEEQKAKMRARRLTEEHKAKLSEAHKGKLLSEETKRKMSLVRRGRKLGEEFRKKMSEVRKGMKFSEEHKQHMREYRLGKKASKETKRKMSEAHRNLSDETRQRLSEASKRMWAEGGSRYSFRKKPSICNATTGGFHDAVQAQGSCPRIGNEPNEVGRPLQHMSVPT